MGDYCSGSNHVLPTYGYARSYSGLSVSSYQKQMTVQELDPVGLRTIGPCAATLAAAEQLDAHRLAVTMRLDSVGGGGMSVLDLARPDILTIQPYSSARMEASGGHIMLNANESAWATARR